MLQPFQTRFAAALKAGPSGAAKYGSLLSDFSQTAAAGPYDGYPGASAPTFPLTASEVVAHFTKSIAAAAFFVCLETIHGPPPTWPVTSGSLFQRSGNAAVISPAGTWSVPLKMSFAYQTGPGMSRILSLSPPYFVAKSAVNTLSFDTTPLLISGSRSCAIRVQWTSAALILTVFGAITCEIGHLSAHRYSQAP